MYKMSSSNSNVEEEPDKEAGNILDELTPPPKNRFNMATDVPNEFQVLKSAVLSSTSSIYNPNVHFLSSENISGPPLSIFYKKTGERNSLV